MSSNIQNTAREIEFRNVLKKLRDGKTLNAREAKIIDERGGENTETDDGVTVGTERLAGLLNLTRARIGQLADAGIVKRNTRNRYELWPSVTGYITYLQGRKTGDTATQQKSEYQIQRNRKLKAEADREELRVAQERRELIPSAEVRAAVSELALILRRTIDSWTDLDRKRRSDLAEQLAHGAEQLLTQSTNESG